MHSPFIHASSLGSKSRFRQLINPQQIHTLPAKPSIWRALWAWC